MERDHRKLHRKRDKKAQHDPHRRMRIERRAQQFRVLECIDARGAVMRKVQGEDRDQHQQAAELGEQEKLRRGVHAALVSPDGDEKIHRDQHQFPGEVEKKQIDREEDADDSSENPQQIEVEKSDALRNFGPGRQHRYDTQK